MVLTWWYTCFWTMLAKEMIWLSSIGQKCRFLCKFSFKRRTYVECSQPMCKLQHSDIWWYLWYWPDGTLACERGGPRKWCGYHPLVRNVGFCVNFPTKFGHMLNACSPCANCDIAIYDGIYGTDLMLHLLVNNVGQGNDVTIIHWSDMSVLVSIFLPSSDRCWMLAAHMQIAI